MTLKEKMTGNILDSAERLFNQQGYCAVGVDILCATARVSKMTMYKYFGNKEGVIEQVLRRRDERFRCSILEALHHCAPGKERIVALLQWYTDWFQSDEYRGCMFIKAQGEFGQTHEGIFTVIQQHKAWLETLIQQSLIGEEARKKRQARMIMVILEGMIAYASVFEQESQFTDIRDTLLQLID